MVGSVVAGDAGSRSTVAEAMRAGPLGRPISAGSMLRPASPVQGAAPGPNARGPVSPTQRATRAGEAIAATAPERRGRQHGIPRNVIGLLLPLDVSPLMANSAFPY